SATVTLFDPRVTATVMLFDVPARAPRAVIAVLPAPNAAPRPVASITVDPRPAPRSVVPDLRTRVSVIRNRPGGRYVARPNVSAASIAAWIAAVSSATPSPTVSVVTFGAVGDGDHGD